MFQFTFSPITIILIISLIIFYIYVRFQRSVAKPHEVKLTEDNRNRSFTKLNEDVSLLPEAPGPRSFPVIGNLYVMGGYEVPYQAFSDLAKKYGDIIKLQLGSVKALVVNGQENIREVLMTKGHHFDSRPNFERYHLLFCGDKENSLAFSDFSELQKTRREMLRVHTFPRSFTSKFQNLDEIISSEVSKLCKKLHQNEICEAKTDILMTCANVFTNHFCSRNFEQNETDFCEMVKNFDEIFYEVNQGYAADFLPFLMFLHKNRLSEMSKRAHKIRDFIEKRIIESRYEKWDWNEKPQDYVESLIYHVKSEEQQMSWDTALFALEDIIGGHSAVGNLVCKILGYLVREPNVQKKIQEEIDHVTRQPDGSNRPVTISDRTTMPYTEAVVLEAIRLIASPIVPRVANQDSSVAGFKVPKDTMIFLNNYDLSMSPKLWDTPNTFQPERFIQNGRLVKPEHFLPFGGGRRSCLGYKMVQFLSFGIVSGIMQQFNICPLKNECYKVHVGSLALPTKGTYRYRFEKR